MTTTETTILDDNTVNPEIAKIQTAFEAAVKTHDETGSMISDYRVTKRRAKEFGLRPCTYGVCKKLHPLSAFTGERETLCDDCAGDPDALLEITDRKKRRKLARQVTVEIAPEVKDTTANQTALAAWLVEELEKEGFEVWLNFESRYADVLVRHPALDGDMWARLQLKTAERAAPMFIDLRRYGADDPARRMLIVCARVKTDGYDLWCLDGASPNIPKSGMLAVSKNGVLGPTTTRLLPTSVAGIVNEILHPASNVPYPRVTREAAILDAERDTQEKNAVEMIVMHDVLGATFSAERPSVHKIYTRFDDAAHVPTLLKTFNLATGHVDVSKRRNGVKDQPYRASDGIERLVEVLIVVVPGPTCRFFLLYAQQPLAELLKPRTSGPRSKREPHAIFETEGVDGVEGVKGNKSISVPLPPDYAAWLGVKYHKPYAVNTWLENTKYGWQPPIEFAPTATLPEALLVKHAWPAPGPLPASIAA